jgi:hypothetical protein
MAPNTKILIYSGSKKSGNEIIAEVKSRFGIEINDNLFFVKL